MQSNYQKDGNYTTNLIHQDASVTDSIPTSTSASTLYWNYNNPLTSTTNPIPAHGTPDKIGQYFSPTNSNQTPLDVNVSVDTSIVAGTYENQLLFSAVGNPTSVNYTITFNMAGGEPQIPKIEERSAAGVYTTTLPSTVPIKPGFQFRNWLSSADGKTYNPGGIIQIYSDEEFTGDVTLTAQYDTTYTYTLNYNCNGGTGCPTNTSFGPTIDTSHSFTIPSATITKTGYTFTGFKGSDGNNYNLGDTVTIPSTAPNFTLTAQYSVNQYTLTVNPNGGTWGGSTSSQSFTQDYNTTKPIANPSANATYTISYNDNGQGATYTGTPTSVNRSFIGWDKAGSGEWNSNTKTYTYGAGDGSLTAQYNNTSDSFALPAISKTGHTCYWASDATGTKYGDGGESKTISSNITIFAYCTINQYTLTVNPNGGTWSGSTSSQSFTQNYDTTMTIANPSANATYTISYNANGQGATYTASPTSVTRPFSSWSLSGAGSFAGGTYQFGAGNGTLTAQYSVTSNAFTLPIIYKAYTPCTWQDTNTGTSYASGATGVKISKNTQFKVVCGTAITQMQQMTSSICTSTPTNSAKTLTDNRDSNTYTVKKLADGKCWMTQDLRIRGRRTLTSANSDVTSNYVLPASAAWDGNCSAKATAACANKQQLNYDSAQNVVWYSWATATAGTGTYSKSAGQVASSSICAKGWKLPSDAQYRTMYSHYPSANQLINGAPALKLTGDAGERGRYADMITSVAQSNGYVKAFTIIATTVYPYNSNYSSSALTMRCISK